LKDNIMRRAKFGLQITLIFAAICSAHVAFGQGQPWNDFAYNAQHVAQSPTASQPSDQIRWQTPVDLDPQFSSNELLIHYGSPLVTAANTVIVPVKTGATGGFEVEAVNGTNGNVIWSQTTDYILPPHDWVPEFGPALTSVPQLYFPGAGGTVYMRGSPDSATGTTTQLAFYSLSNYQANPSAYQQTVMINTPITSDSAGNIYFGFLVTGANPLNLVSGIARIGANGQGTWVSASAAASDSFITEVVYNCAPAISADGSTLYVAVSNTSWGYLLEVNSATLATIAAVPLYDPKSGEYAWLNDDGSASPTIGPDGDVYFGVLENPSLENHDRGWLLHFNSNLSETKTPGSFGWDDTASVVPASMVPSYTGTSTYLLMSKYNDYSDPGIGGSGENKIAVLDPNATEVDPVNGATVMKQVLTAVGLTPNPPLVGVKEWCINSAAVDPATGTILANSEDGKLYRWDLALNTFSQSVVLTPGLGEAYTPTVIGVDGTVYAINNATLFAVGTGSGPADFSLSSPQPVTISSAGANSPNIPLIVTAENGYTGTINFARSSCTISPSGSESTCSFSPASITGSGTAEVTIQTTAPQTAALFPTNLPREFTGRNWRLAALLSTAFACALCLIMQSRAAGARARLGFLTLCLLATSIDCLGCGASNSGSGRTNPGTPVGTTFTVTVTASANSGQLSHTTSFTFVVQ
jgi:hypothetical protein